MFAGCDRQVAPFSPQQVVKAFGSAGVPLETLASHPGPALGPIAILHPVLTERCQDPESVSINTFYREQDLRAYLHRLGLDKALDQWVTVQGASGRAHRNVLVGLDRGTQCLTHAQVDAALAALD